MTELLYILPILAVGITWLIVSLIFKNKINLVQQKLESSESQNTLLKTELDQEKSMNEEQKIELQTTKENYIAIEAEYRALSKSFIEFKENSKAVEDRFQLLANQILEEKTQKFDIQQRKGIKEILDPLKEKIKEFESKVEKSNTDALKRHESLKENLRHLSEQSAKVSQDANNLTRALKGDYKKQGNWGELILESILDKSGLEKDREYFTQESLRDSDGKTKQPDVVIHLPDDKKLIIDSKVSLIAYEAAVTAENEDDALSNQRAHAVAIKNHIDNLTSKNYHDLYRMESPDFVLMFIPIDTAFSLALKENPQLYNYAFDKNIVIVTPSTLLATLKTVETMWRNDKQNRFAIQIADEAGKMYDKFSNFVDDMEKIGKQLNTVQSSYHDSMKKLSTGTGNLVSRAEKLKSLGAKANKQLKMKSEDD